MSTFQTTIRGYKVDLDNDVEGDGQVTGCWISKGRFSGSLELVSSHGYIEDNDDTQDVPSQTIKEIEHWAESHGY